MDGKGLLAVIDMLGSTIGALQQQLAESESNVQTLRSENEKLKLRLQVPPVSDLNDQKGE